MPQVVIAITSGTRWRVPVDCTSATIEVIGGGSAGGGAYSKTTGVALTPLSFAYISVGAGAANPGNSAGDTWFNKTANTPPTAGQTDRGALAKGGGQLPGCVDGAVLGGSSLSGVGDASAKFSGGNGYGIYVICFESGDYYNVYSYGGAAGPNGNGGNGYQSSARGGGGGANGGASSTSSTGGNNRLGSGGGAGGNPPTAGTNGGGGGANTVSGAGAQGGADLIWTDYLGNTYGPAGGGGGIGTSSNNLPAGVNYGGGGIPGGQGLIIITYTPVVTIGNSYTEVLNEYGPTNISTPSRWRIPYGVDTVTIHAIGSGSIGSGSTYTGGGGGAYASSAVNVSTLNNTGAYYLNYFISSGLGFYGSSDAWFNKSSSSVPSTATDGALAKGAINGINTGAQALSCVGSTTWSGGNGGSGGGTTINKGGGGGGAAGPSGAGKNGGNVFSSANSSGSGGGGGGANGGSSTAGGNSTSATVAGAGGAGNSGSGGGSAGTATANAGNGTNGGGGGGGKNTTNRANGGNGAMQAIWTDTGTATQYGPSGGGGGNAALTSTNFGDPGSAGYGGGTGAYVRIPAFSYTGSPLLVLQYTITKAAPVDAATGNMFLMF